ncbi:MAG TPA: hypothetical protein PK239_07380 [Chitinophagales bacterium]|nr:hypothetical protein [Chitinophagales bacterium]
MKVLLIKANKKSEAVIDTSPFSKEINEFIGKISIKYPDWEEFVLSNHKPPQNRISLIKFSNSMRFFGNMIELALLIPCLDKLNANWSRFCISRKEFPIIEDYTFQEGMLLREHGKNTNTFLLVMKFEGVDLIVNQEGKERTYNIDRFRKHNFKFRLLCNNLENKEAFLNHNWPETKN